MTIRVKVTNDEGPQGKTCYATLTDPVSSQPYAPSKPLAPGESAEFYIHKQAWLEVREPVED